MSFFIGSKQIDLHKGDSIYLDATQPHGMLAIGDKAARILTFSVE